MLSKAVMKEFIKEHNLHKGPNKIRLSQSQTDLRGALKQYIKGDSLVWSDSSTPKSKETTPKTAPKTEPKPKKPTKPKTEPKPKKPTKPKTEPKYKKFFEGPFTGKEYDSSGKMTEEFGEWLTNEPESTIMVPMGQGWKSKQKKKDALMKKAMKETAPKKPKKPKKPKSNKMRFVDGKAQIKGQMFHIKKVGDAGEGDSYVYGIDDAGEEVEFGRLDVDDNVVHFNMALEIPEKYWDYEAHMKV